MVFYKKVFSTIHNFDSEATAFALEAMMAAETSIVQLYLEITTMQSMKFVRHYQKEQVASEVTSIDYGAPEAFFTEKPISEPSIGTYLNITILEKVSSESLRKTVQTSVFLNPMQKMILFRWSSTSRTLFKRTAQGSGYFIDPQKIYTSETFLLKREIRQRIFYITNTLRRVVWCIL